MTTETRNDPTSELRAAGPAAIATRIRSGISSVQGRVGWDELPARVRAQLAVLLARVRTALDVPSQSEIAELARRVEDLAAKLDELDDRDRNASAELDAAAVRDELRAELRAVTASAQEAQAAAREATAQLARAANPASAAAAAPAEGSRKTSAGADKAGKRASSTASGQKGATKAGKAQRKNRSETVANKTSSRNK